MPASTKGGLPAAHNVWLTPSNAKYSPKELCGVDSSSAALGRACCLSGKTSWVIDLDAK